MKNMLNRIFKIISSAIFVVLVIIIILILAYVIRVRYLASQGRLGDIKLNFYTILTQSMVPTIYAGDVVITYKNDDNHYKNGDVLTFTSDLNGGINITHRIIKTYVVNGKYSYKTKGDNNSVADNEIVKGERVLGKVILKIPKVGFLQQFLVSKHRWIVVVVIPCLGVIIYDVLKMIKGFRKNEEYNEPENFNDKEIPVAIEPPINQNLKETLVGNDEQSSPSSLRTSDMLYDVDNKKQAQDSIEKDINDTQDINIAPNSDEETIESKISNYDDSKNENNTFNDNKADESNITNIKDKNENSNLDEDDIEFL